MTVIYAAGEDRLAFAVHDRHPYPSPSGTAVVRGDADGKGKGIWTTFSF